MPISSLGDKRKVCVLYWIVRFRTVKTNLIRKAYWLDAEAFWQALVQYLEHYHTERPHQGLGNDPPVTGPPSSDKADGGTFIRHQRVGGLINVYRREVA